MKSPFDDYDHLDDYERRAQGYYDRKVARGEEVLPYIALLAVVTFTGWIFYLVWKALEQLL